MGAVVQFRETQLSLIRRTVAKDCDAAEFDWAIEICKATRLDPLRRQIYFFVFHKDNPKKRNMVPVVAIGGYRAIAARTGNYRPGKSYTVLHDPACTDALTNPLGISHATATVWQHSHGQWFEVEATAYWSEFAPIVDEWKDNSKTGRKLLDPKKDGWHKMPRVMIEKCAEALALRKAWPEEFAGLYAEGETDRAEVLDITPSEMADAADATKRLEVIGGGNRILIDWVDGEPLQPVQIGKLGDAAIQFIREHDAEVVQMWAERNAHGLREYWAHDKDGCLSVKAEIEKKKSQRVAAE